MALHVCRAGDNLYKFVLSVQHERRLSGLVASASPHWPTISPAHAPVCSVLVTDCEHADPSRSELEVKSMAGT